MGQHAVILNKSELALALLERKGAVYSDRPSLFMGGELVGWKDSLPLSPYDDRARAMRAMLARAIGTKALLETYAPMQEAETHQFLRRLLDEPHRLSAHVRKYVDCHRLLRLCANSDLADWRAPSP